MGPSWLRIAVERAWNAPYSSPNRHLHRGRSRKPKAEDIERQANNDVRVNDDRDLGNRAG